MRTAWWAKALISVAMLGGAGLQLGEATDALWAQSQAIASAQAVSSQLDSSTPAQRQAQHSAASTYNKTLTRATMADPWSDEKAATSAEHDRYLATNPGPLGRLRIPSIDVDLPINHDATKASMHDGVGHMYGTSLPVGGLGTHAVLAGHTGSSRRVFLDRLTELRVGDTFVLDTPAGELTYAVDDQRVVSPTDLSSLASEPGRDLVTLVTCHPGPDGANWRLLVRGHRITDTVASSAQSPQTTTQSDTKTTQTHTQPLALRALESAWVPWVQTRLAAGGAMVLIWAGMAWSWWLEKRKARRCVDS